MARTRARERITGKRAAIYARVSDKSQAEDDKTSISEQTGEMEAYCERKGLTITARYQEVGRGWTKKRPEFQRMLADARKGRFDTIVCWKSDRLSRGMYPAAALMEVVEAHQIRLEAVMDAIDMKTFGLMAAIGKIELDNFQERSTMGKRGTAKQGRVPTGGLPYGYRIGDDGRPEVVEAQAEIVRRIFHMYVHEGMGSPSIAVQLTEEGIPTQTGKLLWRQSRVHHILGNATYTGSWVYGRFRHVSTEDGMKVYDQPKETWIEIPMPQIIDDETWERAQARKKKRKSRAKRNTKVLYLLQHLLKCGECGHNFHAKSSWSTTNVRNGKKYRYDLTTPRRYYMCNGMQSMRLSCRERPYIRAERLEEPIWNEVKRVIQNPDLIVAGIDTLDTQGSSSLEAEITQAEQELRSIQMEEDRAIRLFVSGKITESQLDLQRKFITERLESARAKLDDYRAREASGAEKLRLMETVLAWASDIGQGIDELTDEQRKEILQMVIEEVVIDRDNNVDITLAIPIDDESPEPESVAIASKEPFCLVMSMLTTVANSMLPLSLMGLSRFRYHRKLPSGLVVFASYSYSETSPSWKARSNTLFNCSMSEGSTFSKILLPGVSSATYPGTERLIYRTVPSLSTFVITQGAFWAKERHLSSESRRAVFRSVMSRSTSKVAGSPP